MAISNLGTAIMPSESGSLQNNFGVPQEYLAELRVFADGDSSSSGVFTTPLSETITTRLGSNWTQPYNKSSEEAEQNLNNAAANYQGRGAGLARAAVSVGGVALQASGIRLRNQLQTAQVWESSDPIGFSLPFTFVAKTSARTDVHDKVRALLKAVAPSKLAGFMMEAPGPTLLGSELSGRHIELQLGKFLLLNNCIVKDVDVQWDMKIGNEGLPMKATVNVSVESFFGCFTTQDIDDMFNLAPYKGLVDKARALAG